MQRRAFDHQKHLPLRLPISREFCRVVLESAGHFEVAATTFLRIPAKRWPSRYPKLLDCCAAGLLREPQYRGPETGLRRRTRVFRPANLPSAGHRVDAALSTRADRR